MMMPTPARPAERARGSKAPSPRPPPAPRAAVVGCEWVAAAWGPAWSLLRVASRLAPRSCVCLGSCAGGVGSLGRSPNGLASRVLGPVAGGWIGRRSKGVVSAVVKAVSWGWSRGLAQRATAPRGSRESAADRTLEEKSVPRWSARGREASARARANEQQQACVERPMGAAAHPPWRLLILFLVGVV